MCKLAKSSVAVGALLVLSLAVAQTTQADLISVQLQGPGSTNYSGVEAAAAAADSAFGAANVWNHIVGESWPTYLMNKSATGFVDSTGAATSVGLSIAASTDGEGFCTNDSNPTQADALRGGNFSQYVGSGHTGSRYVDFTLTGLAANTPYKMYFYPGGTAGSELPFILAIDRNGNGSLTDESDIRVSGLGGLVTVTSTTGGVVAGQVWRDAAMSDSAWSGFQIATAVPEPSAMLLAVSGLFGLLAYAWRRQK